MQVGPDFHSYPTTGKVMNSPTVGLYLYYIDLNIQVFNQSTTVNVIIFIGGKFCENVGKTFHMGVIFGFIFARGNFREEDKSAKNAKITPTRKFPLLQ